ncbi:MaoC family dehydratase N-terminal domain-containing protein [Halostagnicola sp. A-GB9-2]|uniref:FAS1-like dehydratase domain-containing protein n=1 Tax=Halostagnicola sp. A-GB9-2 TaxID=3048066 RepID=UPI0024BF97AD|nr:MaoC family dehydratase N-terminal domain-containing protein [Halostagnicola sp. A-GB9-2]MDJ1434086.1 MaoC family dehydratase N-terminal domain-containing protein [Halostagnicola sp. A-GB9-2]
MPTKALSELEELVGDSRVTVEGFQIEAGKVAEFARAVTDPNPVFRSTKAATQNGHERIPAPPTYTRVGNFPRYAPDGVEGHGFDLGFRPEYILHGEHVYEYERPAFVGDILTGTTTLTNLYERDGDRAGTMTFAILETAYRDQHGELVLTERATVIESDGAVDTETDRTAETSAETDDSSDSSNEYPRGETLATSNSSGERVRTREGDDTVTRPEIESVAELEVGEDVPTVAVEDIERQDFVRYAGASGDFNPIHYDEPYARAAGNETVFGQGMFAAGISSRVVTDWFGISALESFGVRFQSQLFPGETVTAGGTVTEIDRNKDVVETVLEATTETGKTLLTGTATATLSGDD